MTDDTHQEPADPPDASDVVEGPVGSASLREPSTSGPMGADLDELPSIEDDGSAPPSSGSGRPTGRGEPSAHERQDPGHIGVDWDLTPRTRD
jgi:hypothetical protein